MKSLDYTLYTLIGALNAAIAVEDWKNPKAYIGIALAGLIALKAKRSGSNGNEVKAGNGSKEG